MLRAGTAIVAFLETFLSFFYPLQSFHFLTPLLDSFLRVYPHCETIKQCIYQTFISRQTLQLTIAIFFIIHIIYISHSTDAANNGH